LAEKQISWTLNKCPTLAPVVQLQEALGKHHGRIILTLNGQQFIAFDSSCCPAEYWLISR